MFQKLFDNAAQAGQFSAEELQALADTAEPMQLCRGDHFLREGQVSHHIAYLEEGITMHYQLRDGLEMPCDFTVEDNWLAYLKSFSARQPSDMGIRALEDCSLLTFSADRL